MRGGRGERGATSASRLLFASCALTCLCSVGGAFASSPEEWTAQARARIAASRLDDALQSLDSALASDFRNFDARVLRAKVLSWQGRRAEAGTELQSLLKERPNDPGAGLAMAYLRYYQGDLPGAEQDFGRLLAADSGNRDAREGLERVRKARAASAPRPWRLDADYEHSSFARRPQPAWHQEALQLSRALPDGKTSVYGRVEHYRQFEMSDVAFEAGVVRALHPRANASLAAGWTSAPDFRPEWSLAADADFLALTRPAANAVSPPVPAVPAVRLFAGFRCDAYESVKVFGFDPGVRLEWNDPWALEVKASRVQEEGGDPLWGGFVRFEGPLGLPSLGPVSGLRFSLGAADAPETVAAATVSTRSVFAGLGADVGSDWIVHAGYARDDREGSWVRHGVNVGVGYRF